MDQYFFGSLILCPAVGFVTILLKARPEELIVVVFVGIWWPLLFIYTQFQLYNVSNQPWWLSGLMDKTVLCLRPLGHEEPIAELIVWGIDECSLLLWAASASAWAASALGYLWRNKICTSEPGISRVAAKFANYYTMPHPQFLFYLCTKI
jgi:hypothetical protein